MGRRESDGIPVCVHAAAFEPEPATASRESRHRQPTLTAQTGYAQHFALAVGHTALCMRASSSTALWLLRNWSQTSESNRSGVWCAGIIRTHSALIEMGISYSPLHAEISVCHCTVRSGIEIASLSTSSTSSRAQARSPSFPARPGDTVQR